MIVRILLQTGGLVAWTCNSATWKSGLQDYIGLAGFWWLENACTNPHQLIDVSDVFTVMDSLWLIFFVSIGLFLPLWHLWMRFNKYYDCAEIQLVNYNKLAKLKALQHN